MLATRLGALALVALLPAACSGAQAGGGSAQATADGVTKAVYADDIDGVTSSFDDGLKSQVSRAEVGALSDKMHALGAYKGLTFMSTDPAKSEFDYRADFDKGSMNVVIRMDTDGKLSAYRIFAPT
ncbi:MAG: hypothetical protein KGN02_04450 [bacterium]|nr:hypothetical protein [bacterium]